MSLQRSQTAPDLLTTRSHPHLVTSTLIDKAGFVIGSRSTNPFFEGELPAVPMGCPGHPATHRCPELDRLADRRRQLQTLPPMRLAGPQVVMWAAIMNLPYQASAYDAKGQK